MKQQVIDQTINLFYTIVFYTPVVALWYMEYNPGLFWPALILSLLPFFAGDEIFNRLQLSHDKRFYRLLGIPYFQTFTQKGKYAKKLGLLLENKSASFSRSEPISLKREIMVFEKYHYACFLFFTITTVSAIHEGRYGLFLALCLSNILYNVVPILIQQYNKLRLKKLEALKVNYIK